VNKKKQKNSVNLGRAGFTATGPASKKFLRRFFQKAATFFAQKRLERRVTAALKPSDQGAKKSDRLA
jgi:hypothetical protein